MALGQWAPGFTGAPVSCAQAVTHHIRTGAGFWESAAPYGTSPTCLTTVPSHTHHRNAYQQTSSQPATCRYSNAGVRPAMHFCSATANCLPSAYGSGHQLHPTGPRQPALNPVPSHTHHSRTGAVLCEDCWWALSVRHLARRVCTCYYLAGVGASTPRLHAPPPLYLVYGHPWALRPLTCPDRCLPCWATHQMHGTQSQSPSRRAVACCIHCSIHTCVGKRHQEYRCTNHKSYARLFRIH
mgnify:CR=1 FL=1